MKTIHYSIIVITVITIAGISYFTKSYADGVPSLEGSSPPNLQLSQIAAYGNNVYIAYKTNIEPSAILFRKSTDEGITFDKIIKINDSYTDVSEPNIAVSGNNVYMTWFATYLDANTKILFKKSSNNGTTFGDTVILDPNTGKGQPIINTIAAFGSNVYMAMNYINSSSSRVSHIFRTSMDNGDTFGRSVTISNGESLDTKIAISEPNIYVTWVEESICPHGVLEDCQKSNVFFRKSVDNGITFTKTVNLSNTTLVGSPQMATLNNNVFVVWQEGQYPNIFFTKSSDGGLHFSNKTNLSKKLGDSTDPQVIVSNGTIFVAFHHYSNFKNQSVYITKSSDGGNTFSDPIVLINATSSNYDFTSGKNLYAIYDDFNHTTTRWDVFFTKSADNGNTFDNATNLSSEVKNGGSYGMIATEGKNVYVGWLTQSYDDIYFRASHDNGNTFGDLVNIHHEETVPEFPLAQVTLATSIASFIVLYRIGIKK